MARRGGRGRGPSGARWSSWRRSSEPYTRGAPRLRRGAPSPGGGVGGWRVDGGPASGGRAAGAVAGAQDGPRAAVLLLLLAGAVDGDARVHRLAGSSLSGLVVRAGHARVRAEGGRPPARGHADRG